MTSDWHVNRAGRAAARMAEQFAPSMRARLVLLALTVLSAAVRQRHWVEARLVKSSAETLVPRQLRFGVAVVAVGTSPRVKGLLGLGVVPRVVIGVVIVALRNLLLLFVFFVFGRIGAVFAGVEFVNPSLHTAEVEGLAALDAVPDGASLVDRVRTNYALLSCLGKSLNQVLALVRDVVGSRQEVMVVVLYRSSVLGVLLTIGLPHHLDLVVFGNLVEVEVGAAGAHIAEFPAFLASRSKIGVFKFGNLVLRVRNCLLFIFSIVFMEKWTSFRLLSGPARLWLFRLNWLGFRGGLYLW